MSSYSHADIELIESSPFFDGEWYKNRYPDVALTGMRASEHYLWLGFKLNRNPSPHFDARFYSESNPDVTQAGLNPLLHFVRHGIVEGRPPTREFSRLQYKKGCRDQHRDWPNVLLCAHDCSPHLFGGERSFIDILEQLDALNVNVIVTTPKSVNPQYTAEILRKCTGLYTFFYPTWSEHGRPEESHKNHIRQLFRLHKVDILYVNTIFLRDFQVEAKLLGVKSVCHIRELVAYDEELRLRIGLEAKDIVADLWARSDVLIANSHATQVAFATERTPVYAPNVVDGDAFDLDNVVKDEINFAIISSNSAKKGVAEFVEVARRCATSIPRARFTIVGPSNPYLEQLDQGGLPNNLTLRGYAGTPQDALQGVHVVLSLSHFAESFGRTVAEAQCARRPVIAYRWGAIPELVENGVTGFLVPYRDLDSVIQSVRLLCDNPELISSLGSAGRSKMLREYPASILREALRTTFEQLYGQRIALRHNSTSKPVTVVIPVHNGYQAVERCLHSVKRWTNKSLANVLVVDDGSSDERIMPLLQTFVEDGFVEVVANSENIGYTRTINRAIERVDFGDIILLNSDTVVTPLWIEGLRHSVYSASDIGTATAMSDNAGAFSFPRADVLNQKPDDVPCHLWASAITRATSESKPVDVPTGNGFCMYIRRDVFEQIGLFDDQLFPRGYGEENDFCMRALKAGWRNVISPKAYIFHERSVSFGIEKKELLQRATEVLSARHPSYATEVGKAFDSAEMRRLRSRAAVIATLSDCDAGASVDGPSARFIKLNSHLLNWDDMCSALQRRIDGLVSIVICSHFNPELTINCVNSIYANSVGHDIEVIIVENGSDSDTRQSLYASLSEYPTVKFIDNGENLNFSLGNNIGFSESCGTIVVFINNDTIVTKGWLSPLVRSLDDRQVKGCQPKLLFPDGTIQCVGIVFSGIGPFGYPLYARADDENVYSGRRRRFRAVTAACIAMRASDFAEARGFDPSFMNGQEDVDLCLRVGNGTPSFEYVPESTVFHFEAKSTGRGTYLLHNRRKFFTRWNGRIERDDMSYYIEDGFQASDYRPDIPELTEEKAACWRPMSLQSRS